MVEDPVIARASELIKAHQYQQAAHLLSGFLQKNPPGPGSIPAWLLMARVVGSADKKIDCLQQVLKIDPENETAVEILKQVMDEQPIIPDPTPPIWRESATAGGAVRPLEGNPFIGPDDRIPDAIDSLQPTGVGNELPATHLAEIQPEINPAVGQIPATVAPPHPLFVPDEVPAPVVTDTPPEISSVADQIHAAIETPQTAFVTDEIPATVVVDIPPEMRSALDQIKSIAEYFEDVETVTEKMQGTMGPDYLKLRGMIREKVSAGFILQSEEYTPQKFFGKPEVIFAFGRPKATFRDYSHDYPLLCGKYNSQDTYLEFILENITGEHLASVYRSLEKRAAGLELLRVLAPDRTQVRFQAVVREADDEHQVIDLYRGKRVSRIGEILRDRKQHSEIVNASGGIPLLNLVDHSGKDPKRAVFSIQKETSLLRYQIHAFDYFSREMLIRVGDPHKLSEDEEAVIMMTGLLAVDYMI